MIRLVKNMASNKYLAMDRKNVFTTYYYNIIEIMINIFLSVIVPRRDVEK